MTDSESDDNVVRTDLGEAADSAVELDASQIEISRLRAALKDLQAEAGLLRARVAELEGNPPAASLPAPIRAWSPRLFADGASNNPLPLVDAGSPGQLKVELFRSLFVGRDDVYSYHWENPATGKKGWAPARAAGPGAAKARSLLAFTDKVITDHLSGRLTAGLYPLMPGDSCRLLACDLDGAGWELDARAYLEVCAAFGVPAYLERSRSGNGAHLWTFFDAPVPAATARALGAALLREVMALRAELDLQSYDRLFPSQDFLPTGASFGNLIALPLQRESRQRGTTVFLDPTTFEPWADQWAFLCSISRLSPEAGAGLRSALRPMAVGPEEVRHPGHSRILRGDKKPPAVVHAVRGSMVGIERAGVPPWLVADLKHLATTHNPEFHRRQQQRRSTWPHSAVIRSYEEDLEYLWLPRGLEEGISRIVTEAGSQLDLADTLQDPPAIELCFGGTLTVSQREVVGALAGHDLGVLVAPTGAGKTAMACALIARHRMPTLVVVDRQPLADQWRVQLGVFLGLTGSEVGQLGGGRRRRGRVVDLAMFQSIARRVDDPEVFAGYGLVVVDECHHVPAESYEAAMRHAPVRRWLGLTATPKREDGRQPLMTMQCGPIRKTLVGGSGPLVLRVITHESLADPDLGEQAPYGEFVSSLVSDEERNATIVTDVVTALERGRQCLLLTQRVGHLEHLAGLLRERGHEPHFLRGGMAKKARAAVFAAISSHPADRPILIVATGPYAGEGFDCPRLDTLFLALPIKSKTKVVQYVGRIMRDFDGKSDVEVHDYYDKVLPIFRPSRAARVSAYTSLGFDVSPH